MAILELEYTLLLLHSTGQCYFLHCGCFSGGSPCPEEESLSKVSRFAPSGQSPGCAEAAPSFIEQGLESPPVTGTSQAGSQVSDCVSKLVTKQLLMRVEGQCGPISLLLPGVGYGGEGCLGWVLLLTRPRLVASALALSIERTIWGLLW